LGIANHPCSQFLEINPAASISLNQNRLTISEEGTQSHVFHGSANIQTGRANLGQE
jgi:hypothetical protein